MGRRISKEFLHPSILEGVNNKIGNLDSLETDAKGNMVQAINELVEKLDNSAEITTLRDLLASILENKGVDVTEEDDMASLITKVDEEFTKSITVVSSDEVFMTQHNFVPTSKPNSYQGNEPIQLFKLIATFNGSITCSTTLRQYNNEYNAYLNINHIRDNVVITTKSYQTTTTLEINCLIENILPGDVIEITGHTTTGLSTESMVLSAPVVLYGSIVK